jgi:hypothetical protein
MASALRLSASICARVMLDEQRYIFQRIVFRERAHFKLHAVDNRRIEDVCARRLEQARIAQDGGFVVVRALGGNTDGGRRGCKIVFHKRYHSFVRRRIYHGFMIMSILETSA